MRKQTIEHDVRNRDQTTHHPSLKSSSRAPASIAIAPASEALRREAPPWIGPENVKRGLMDRAMEGHEREAETRLVRPDPQIPRGRPIARQTAWHELRQCHSSIVARLVRRNPSACSDCSVNLRSLGFAPAPPLPSL